jgi:hypothetical protein
MLKNVGRAAQRGLVWCLVALLPWLGLGLVQQQVLGPLHVHAAPAAASLQPGAEPLLAALDWWWAQVLQQTHARQHAHAAAAAHAHAPGHAHGHRAWQRHHHAPADTSVISLQVPGDSLGAQAAAASLLLPMLGLPADSLRVAAASARPLGWPRAEAARFSSWGLAPPLRPPRG